MQWVWVLAGPPTPTPTPLLLLLLLGLVLRRDFQLAFLPASAPVLMSLPVLPPAPLHLLMPPQDRWWEPVSADHSTKIGSHQQFPAYHSPARSMPARLAPRSRRISR